MYKRINSNNPNYKFFNITNEEFFTLFNKIYTKGNSFRKYRGTAVQTEKGENNKYFPTKMPSKYVDVDNNGNEKELPWEWIYKDFESVERAAKDYKQIVAGRNHYERCVQVLDVDKDFKSNTIEKLFNKLDKHGIPHPNCIIVNPETNHYQVHWFIDRAYNKPYQGNFPQRFHNTRHAINLLFEGDDKFTGGFIKNPYYEGLNTTWFSHEPVSQFTLDTKVEAAFVNENEAGFTYPEFKKYQKELKKAENKLKTREKSAIMKISNIESKSRSRHMESLEHGRDDAFAYMRDHNGSLDKGFIKERVIFWQWEVVNDMYDPNRLTIEDDVSINSIVDSIYEFCVTNYKPMVKKGGNTANNYNYEYGAEIKHLEGLLTFFTIQYLKNEGMKTKDIAARLCITVAGVNTSLRKHSSNLEEAFDLIKTFYGQHRNYYDDTSLRVCSKIEELFNLIGYKYTEEDQKEANEATPISFKEFYDDLFELFEDAIIEHSNGYVEYDKNYWRKEKPKIA